MNFDILKMRRSVIFALFSSIIYLTSAAPRDRRFAIGIIGIGPNVPSYITKGLFPNSCVVTGNVFFAHGIRMKELNESEMKEFEDYKLALEKFKKERRAYEIYLSDLYRDKSMISPRKPSPELPERPSFCQPEQVKQHLLEGCTVQNQKIYIGNEYARDLTDKEIEELEVYTKKQQEYEKDLQKILIDNYRNIDNNNLVQFPIDEFPDIENELTEVNSDEKPTTITISKPRPAGYSLTLPSPPERPNFCTMIL